MLTLVALLPMVVSARLCAPINFSLAICLSCTPVSSKNTVHVNPIKYDKHFLCP